MTRRTSPAATDRVDLYSRITAQIVEQIEKGARPWYQPWAGSCFPRRHTGERYRGVNVLLLWAVAEERGYRSPTWMTYRQAQALGGQVRKGEKGSPVVFATHIERTERADDGSEVKAGFPVLRSYTVFNVEQIDGLPSEGQGTPINIDRPEPSQVLIEQQDAAERFFVATGARFEHGGSRAFYRPSDDRIQLPPASSFVDRASYLAIKAHELIHWTGHESRLARDFGKRFGDDARAVEELTAELGAAFLCSALGVADVLRDDHAAYLASWLKVLKQDPRALFTVAAKAQQAVDSLYRLAEAGEPLPDSQQNRETTEEEESFA